MWGPGGCGGQEGRPAGGGVADLSPHPVLTPQELSKRQVVAVGHLEVPVELAGLLRAVAGTSALGDVGGRAGQGAKAAQASSVHRPQDSPGAPGGPCTDSPASG